MHASLNVGYQGKSGPGKIHEVILVIDVTEIYLEKPSNTEAQQLTFSSYKNSNTLKALIGITPSCSVSFFSQLYDGSISDKDIKVYSFPHFIVFCSSVCFPNNLNYYSQQMQGA